MKQSSQEIQHEAAPAEAAAHDEHIAPAPRVSVQAFCENVDTAAAIQSAGEDRRLAKVHLRVQMGGMAAAVEAYQSAPTPRVIIIGNMNDVTLYRELVKRGVSDYLISPVGVLQVVRAVCGLYSAPDAKP